VFVLEAVEVDELHLNADTNGRGYDMGVFVLKLPYRH